jgi:valyl-tRNA synthetase
MPFITEDIYQKYYRKNEKIKSIHLTKWPSSSGDRDSKDFDLFIEILGKIRQEKSLNKKSMNSQIILTIRKEDAKQLKEVIEDLKDVANALEIREGELKVDFV